MASPYMAATSPRRTALLRTSSITGYSVQKSTIGCAATHKCQLRGKCGCDGLSLSDFRYVFACIGVLRLEDSVVDEIRVRCAEAYSAVFLFTLPYRAPAKL